MNVDKYFKKSSLIPVIVQNYETKKVLMLGFTNAEALQLTLKTGTVWFWSRSRKELWNKGATSGNYLHVIEIYADCDDDTILIFANPDGPTCHTGAESCFFKKIERETKYDE